MHVEQFEAERLDAAEDAVQHGCVAAREVDPRHAAGDVDLEVLELLAQHGIQLTGHRDHVDLGVHARSSSRC